MITEEDLAGLELAGMEPEQRFRAIERIASRRLDERWPDDTCRYNDYDYMSSVLEAARLFGISDLTDWELPARCSDWKNTCRDFRADAGRISQRILFEMFSKPGRDPNTVALDAATKEQIRHHLNQVRAIIENDGIPSWKKRTFTRQSPR